MELSEIDNIQLDYLNPDDYDELKTAMVSAYQTMPDAYWRRNQIEKLVEIFPEGQAVNKVNGQLAGCALSIIVNYDSFSSARTHKDITANYTFESHDNDGDVLYGVDIFIKPEFRGLRLGHRL